MTWLKISPDYDSKVCFFIDTDYYLYGDEEHGYITGDGLIPIFEKHGQVEILPGKP